MTRRLVDNRASLSAAGSEPNDDVIVIPSHVSGLRFLENLLTSFGNYDKYPILIVINEYKDEVEPLYQAILEKFSHLPLSVGRLKSNSFEFGGLLYAYEETQYRNFFLLPHSCEIVDPGVFEIAFEEYRDRSAAFFLRRRYNRVNFWESHIGKYRRETLDAFDFRKFQPCNIFQATFLSEFCFTRFYHLQEPTAHTFYTLVGPSGEVIEKFGKPRLKMATPYLIKWKTHWSALMLLRSLPRDENRKRLLVRYVVVYLIWQFRGLLFRAGYYSWEGVVALFHGAPWSPRFYHWRRQLRNHPRLTDDAFRFRRSGYNAAQIQFFLDDGGHLLHDHALDANSLVLDVGAYDGEYADALFRRYGCEIHCFEPVPEWYAGLERRFHGTPQVHIHQVGLGDHTYRTTMGMMGPGSSEFGFALSRRQVEMRDVTEVFATLDRDVDLLKINIEGGEYRLLKRMLEADLLRRCRKVMVQFHDRPISARLARRLRRDLIAGIERTHDPTFSYPFVWEAWERKRIPVAGAGRARDVPVAIRAPAGAD